MKDLSMRYFKDLPAQLQGECTAEDEQTNRGNLDQIFPDVGNVGEDHGIIAAARADGSQHKCELRMDRHVYKNILMTVGSRPAETGGVLLGQIGFNDITDFFFDQTAKCSPAGYSPDHITLMGKMKNDWLPAGIDMKGFVHSHPARIDCLTRGDLAYIKRLLIKNEDMDLFAAPIVIPAEYRMRPIVVRRAEPDKPCPASLILL